MVGGSCLDLRKYENNEKTHEAFSKLISGKQFYRTIIETKKENKICPNCKYILKGDEKFCPECGFKILATSEVNINITKNEMKLL